MIGSVPDFITIEELTESFEEPMSDAERRALWREVWPSTGEPSRRRFYEYADECALPTVSPKEWLAEAKHRRKRKEWHPVAQYLADHADYGTGRNVRPSVQGMAKAIGKSRANCQIHVRRLVDEGWLRMTGKHRRVIVYALAVPGATR